ncbi:MAG: PAS domain S-box protein [Anaerolineae bacterium]|nr:PAS domain S-box protein [Anaerolineae bacterium]
MNPSRIVIVEDDVLVARSIRHKLGQAGYVVPALLTSGQEAIQSVSALSPDLVLMDIDLGEGIDGVQASEEIHRQLDVPIIYLTAFAGDAILDRAKLTGPYGYVLKPFRDSDLLSNIEIALYKHQMERELRARQAETCQAQAALQASQARFQELVEAMQEVFWVRDLETQQLVYLSPSYERVWGRTVTSAIESPGSFLESVHPDDLERVRAEFDRSLAGETVVTEYRIIHPDGTIRWVWIRSQCVQTGAGAPRRQVGIAIDITDRVRAEQAQQQAHEQLRLQSLVLNQIQDRVTITDLSGKITYVNDAEVESLGRPRQELIGQSTESYGEDPTRGATQQEILQKTLRDGHWRGEVVNYAADGREVILDCRTQLVRDDTGAPIALCGIATDITEHKVAEARMQVMSEMLDIAPNSITVHDFKGTFLYANQKTFELHQYNQDEFMTLNLHDLDVPESEALIASRMQQIVETGEASFQVGHFRRDGSVLPLEIFVKQVNWLGQPAMLSIGTDITARKTAEQEREKLVAQIRAQAQQLQDILNAMPEGVLLLDPSFKIVIANSAAQRDLSLLTQVQVGQTLDSLGGISILDLMTWPQDPAWHEVRGKSRIFEVIGRTIRLEPNQIGWVVVLRDMTQEREMQAHIRHQDRLAVIGQLAGGVAHDFNNLLTAIKGYNEFAIEALSPETPVLSDLQEVRRAADRAAALTNQLLIFSRKQVLQPQVLSLNDVINEMEKMLGRLIGENIQLDVVLDSNLAPVLADASQMEQVVMNLCVNARDAMPEGGQLTIKTGNVIVEEWLPHPSGLKSGVYVMLSVTDTGVGMSQEVKLHLFEPFFTTKETGKGTGLGLSTVWGIVQQSGGQITVDSQIGMGTTFRIYLPPVEPVLVTRAEPIENQELLTGTETLLLVEDDPLVRASTERMLTGYRYRVLSASLPSEALRLIEQEGAGIALLITDVVMPEMNGRELAQKLQARLPHLRVLYISGYIDDKIFPHSVLAAGATLLEKPFAPQELARKVRETLDA